MSAVVRSVTSRVFAALPFLLCVTAIVTCVALIDLKGISTDEGIRLGIVNGGRQFTPEATSPAPTYRDVLQTVAPYAYQPGYYLFLNTLMRAAERHDLLFFRLVNVALLALCLGGLLGLTRAWPTSARAFLIGLFAFNAYLIMHVLQIREYIAAVALYIWGTRLVLHLDDRHLDREWPDIAAFLGYGLMLTAGFYLQTWTVFPAAAQGIFLVSRRRPQQVRFLAHLGLAYLVVFTLVWPYLQSNLQKVNVGLWAPEKVTLLGQLANGFNLVLAGQPRNHSWFTDWLPFGWLALTLYAASLLWQKRRALPSGFVHGVARRAWLLILCSAVPLAFQIIYFYRVEPLSVWPRYFIIHYFFLTTLIGLAFQALMAARIHLVPRRENAILAASGTLLVVSAFSQVHSYRRDPYFDTSTNAAVNWPAIATAVAQTVQPTDVVFTYDFVTRATLTGTHPLSNRVAILPDLETISLEDSLRLLYLESSSVKAERPTLIQRMAARGFREVQEWSVTAGDGSGPLEEWCILTFSRR
ncbi:MAG: hypothetical protein C0518_00530 [Opitutus sp.]|nr:hypothetical protein [Opitutus sp.]